MKLSSKVLAVAFVVAIALTVTTVASAASFDDNLTIGSTGAEVTALQTFLVGGGYLTMPAGVNMGYFGALTQAALAKYQVAKGITPAVGYFGPITRAAVNAGGAVAGGALCPNGMTLASNCTQAPGVVVSVPLCPNGMTLASNCVTAPGTVSANGTDGTLTAAPSSYVGSGIQVKKGETKNVLATTLKASVGPVTVTRAGVHFSARPWLLFSQVILKDSTGKVIATKPLSSDADATEITVGSDYLVTFDGVNYTVTPGINQDLTVAVSVLPATDKITNGMYVDVAFDTLRTINGIGWTDTVAAATFPLTAHAAEVGGAAFTLTSTGSVADIYTRISPNSPATRQVSVSLTQTTPDVVLGTFSLKSANNSSTLNTLTVSLASTTLVAGATGVSGPSTAFSNVRLFNGSQSFGGTLTNAGVVTFSNLTIPLSQDVWQDLTVKADVNASTTATGLTVALASTNIVVTDANYGTATYETNTATSNAITLTVNALSVSNTSATLGAAILSSNTTVGVNASYTFTLTNTSSNDLYVSATSSYMVATTTTGTAGTSTLPAILTVSPSTYNGDADGTAGYSAYVIPAGLSRTFTLVGALRGTSGQTVNLKITRIYYGTTAALAFAQGTYINFGLENLVTNTTF